MLKRAIGPAIPVVLLMSACGATVGDPCTVASDCSNQICINQPWAPGGYCSKTCTPGDNASCPSGSTCIDGGNGPTAACFRVCAMDSDCRSGYVCRPSRTNQKLICMGPAGGV
jgi:hypothetical protein